MGYGRWLLYLHVLFCFEVILPNSCFWSVQDTGDSKCMCPHGFKGDGIKTCDGKMLGQQIFITKILYLIIHILGLVKNDAQMI